ncbi:MAG: type II toxin-antitoxin system HigB family toxin [Bacteroidales bacterium]|nr:type II toxin-antitoxin system HigB family toxin [Bacteroidales bacterium]
MRVIAVSTLRDFWSVHSDARLPLTEWYIKVCGAHWKSVADIKNDFNSVDYVGNQHFVFNIKGNRYRLVAAIKFIPGLVYIRFMGTHKEYDKIDVSKV